MILTSSVNFYFSIFWTVPTLCAESWIEKFNEIIKKKDFDACLYYEKLSKIFSIFFFLFYLILQLLSIVMIFSSIAKFVHQESVGISEYLLLSGYLTAIGPSDIRIQDNYITVTPYFRKQHFESCGSNPDSGVSL